MKLYAYYICGNTENKLLVGKKQEKVPQHYVACLVSVFRPFAHHAEQPFRKP